MYLIIIPQMAFFPFFVVFIIEINVIHGCRLIIQTACKRLSYGVVAVIVCIFKHNIFNDIFKESNNHFRFFILVARLVGPHVTHFRNLCFRRNHDLNISAAAAAVFRSHNKNKVAQKGNNIVLDVCLSLFRICWLRLFKQILLEQRLKIISEVLLQSLICK